MLPTVRGARGHRPDLRRRHAARGARGPAHPRHRLAGASRFACGEGAAAQGPGSLSIDAHHQVTDLRRSSGMSRPCAGSRSRSGAVGGRPARAPSGAGKTTTVEILEGYRRAVAGRGTVLGGSARPGPAPSGEDSGSFLQAVLLPRATFPEAIEHFARPTGGRVTGRDDHAGGSRGSPTPHQALLRPSAAPPRPRPGAGRRPRPGVPRRAHHRLRPAAPRIAWDVVRHLGSTRRSCSPPTISTSAQELADRVAIVEDGLVVAEGRPMASPGHRRLPVWSLRGPARRASDRRPHRRLHRLTRDALAQGSGSRASRSPGHARGRLPRAHQEADWHWHHGAGLGAGTGSSAATSGASPSADFFDFLPPAAAAGAHRHGVRVRRRRARILVRASPAMGVLANTFTSLAVDLHRPARGRGLARSTVRRSRRRLPGRLDGLGHVRRLAAGGHGRGDRNLAYGVGWPDVRRSSRCCSRCSAWPASPRWRGLSHAIPDQDTARRLRRRRLPAR